MAGVIPLFLLYESLAWTEATLGFLTTNFGLCIKYPAAVIA
jgi:hypothetical protein